MHSVGIKTLKNRLSEYVRAAAAGQAVAVTDRGRVVAELLPPRTARGRESPAQRWAALVQQGLVRPALRASRAVPPRLPGAGLDTLLKELDADREDR